MKAATALFLSLSPLIAQTAIEKTPYVSAAQLNVADLLPYPPPAGSESMKSEVAELHRLQETRSAKEIAHARADDEQEDIFVFADVLGARFRREGLPLTARLSDRVHANEGVIVNPAKSFFQRPRPYFFDVTIKPVCKMKTNRLDFAYPGGHATSGYLEGLVLMMIVPERRDAILGRADDYAHSRLVCGVHYATDLVASKSVAYAITALLLNNASFVEDLAGAKAETRHALGLPAHP